MKFNKWTLGLAAVGVVSLGSVARAEEKASSLMTAVPSTTISGYVDTSVYWTPGNGNQNVPGYSFNNSGKQDGFNLDQILVRLLKPLDETPWAAGYDIDLFYGPDANALGTTSTGLAGSDFVIKQAYVNLRTPVGNGIEWKLGVFDNWIGYESTEAPSNPNFTRSYGYTIEPTTFTGLMGSSKVSELINVSAGIANTVSPTIGGSTLGSPVAGGTGGRSNPPKGETFKAYMGSVALTAPNDWGSIAGSTLYAGGETGWNNGLGSAVGNIYAGATINTPVAGLKAGFSYDYAAGGANPSTGSPTSIWADSFAVYTSYQMTEKLSLNGRAEYFWQAQGPGALPAQTGLPGAGNPGKVFALTGTVQYDLWKNVLSRLELRWDHQADGLPDSYGGPGSSALPGAVNGNSRNAFVVIANIAYKF
jgi:hypothetical protein